MGLAKLARRIKDDVYLLCLTWVRDKIGVRDKSDVIFRDCGGAGARLPPLGDWLTTGVRELQLELGRSFVPSRMSSCRIPIEQRIVPSSFGNGQIERLDHCTGDKLISCIVTTFGSRVPVAAGRC